MLAVRIKNYGPAESLSLADVPMPQPSPQEVLVRVRATGVNRLDLLLREGRVFQVPLPRTPGTDFAGEIVATGAKVTDRQEGDRVFAAPILSCGICECCVRGEDNLCTRFGTVGSTTDGGYARYALLPARNAVPVPAGMDWTTAASFGLTYATAAAMLRRGRLTAGETVLVLGANGGLGHAAVELAHALGARVIAVSRSPSNDEALTRRGAAAVVRPGPALPDAVHALTDGRGADLAFEHVATATFAESLASLATGGRLILGGVTTGTEANLDLKAVFTKRLEILGCRGSGRCDLDQVLRLMQDGRVHPLVHKVLPLEDAAAAHRMLESGEVMGKIILLP